MGKAGQKRRGARDGFGLDPLDPASARERGLGIVVDPRTGPDDSAGVRFAQSRDLGLDEITALLTTGLGKRAVDLLPEEALAAGYTVTTGPTTADMEERARACGWGSWEDAAEAEQTLAENLDVLGSVRRTWQAARAYGDALGVLGFADGRPSAPAPYGSGRNDLMWIRTVDRRDFTIRGAVRDLGAANFGDALQYDVHNVRPRNPRRDPFLPGLGTVHPSRAFRLTTDDGLSIFQRVAEPLAALLSGLQATRALLGKAGGMVFYQPGWAEMVSADEDTARRVVDGNLRAWSQTNTMILEADGSRVESPLAGSLSGVDSALAPLMAHVAANLGIPMSKFYMLMPAGFSSDENSRLVWNLSLERGRTFIAPYLLAVRQHTWAQVLRGMVPRTMRVAWNPLSPPSTSERAAALTAFAGALTALRALEVMGPEGCAAAIGNLPEAQGLELSPPDDGPEDPTDTWVTPAEGEAFTGVPVRMIRRLGELHRVRRRMVLGRWEYALADLQRVAAASVEPAEGQPQPATPDPVDPGPSAEVTPGLA